MGQRFGYDFSGVKIHTGKAAAQSARDVSAHAYTVGHNIVFAENQFSPETHQGRKILTHELTHVVQQSENINSSKEQISIGFSSARVMIQRFRDIGQETYSICTKPPYSFFAINTLCQNSNANTKQTHPIRTGTETEWRTELRQDMRDRKLAHLFLRAIYISDAEYERYALANWEGLAPHIPTIPSRAMHRTRPDDMTASRSLINRPDDREKMSFAKATILRGGQRLSEWNYEYDLLSRLIMDYQGRVLEGEARANRIFTQQQSGLVLPVSHFIFEHPQEESVGTSMMTSASALLYRGMDLYINNYRVKSYN